MIDDIEELNFDIYEINGKMSDWIFETVQGLRSMRSNYQNRYHLHVAYNLVNCDVPELVHLAENSDLLDEVYGSVRIY